MTSPTNAIHPMLRLTDEVAEALAAGGPVVALESTIISHGLPRPDNLRIAREIEDAVRAGGAVPATIAVVGGQPHVGLDDEALQRFTEVPRLLIATDFDGVLAPIVADRDAVQPDHEALAALRPEEELVLACGSLYLLGELRPLLLGEQTEGQERWQ